MGTGILVCGLNGSGKSTLGKALAEKLDFHFIDNEDLYFPKTDPRYTYAAPRTREEVEQLLLHEIKTHENFVFASVKGDYGEAVCPLFQYAVLISVPKDIRLQRVRNLVTGCCQAGIYTRRKKAFLLLLHHGQKIWWKTGYNLCNALSYALTEQSLLKKT